MKNIIIFFLFIISTACNHDPIIINYGKDNCDFCKMTIMEEKYSAQCISKKGKTYRFDDVHCLISFLHNGGVWSNEIERIYFSDFKKNGNWVQPENSFFLKSDLINSPMGGNYAVFSSEADRSDADKQYKGEKLAWDDIKSKK